MTYSKNITSSLAAVPLVQLQCQGMDCATGTAQEGLWSTWERVPACTQEVAETFLPHFHPMQPFQCLADGAALVSKDIIPAGTSRDSPAHTAVATSWKTGCQAIQGISEVCFKELNSN